MPASGTGRVYRRGNTWWIDYGYRGDRHRESSKSTKKGVAVALLRRRMEEMGRGKLVGRSEERVSFEDLMGIVETDYTMNGRKSLDSLRHSMKHLKGFFGTSRALDVTTDRVKRYVVYRQEEGASNATIRLELSALKRAFNLALQAGVLTTKPHIPSVRVSNTREGFFEPAELARVLQELPEAERAVVPLRRPHRMAERRSAPAPMVSG